MYMYRLRVWAIGAVLTMQRLTARFLSVNHMGSGNLTPFQHGALVSTACAGVIAVRGQCVSRRRMGGRTRWIAARSGVAWCSAGSWGCC